jgi:drug/metabolite transporter (DMT)-like permease
MMVAIIGSLIIGLDDWSYEKNKIQGDLLALLAALFASFYLLLIERLRDRFDAITIVQWNAIMSSIILLPIWVISGEEILAFDRGEWFTITGLALTLILSRVLIVYALKWLSSEFIAVVILLDPIFAGILAWVIFSETVDFYNLLAFPVILLGIYLATISQFDTEVPYQVN